MTDKTDWQGRAGQSWADEWRRTDRSWGGLTEMLLRHTRDFTFANVLDVGCGAGELSLAIARGRPASAVVGVDVSPQLIDVARERGRNLGNVSFELGDAASWQPAKGFTPDLLVSRHGVMFFADPVAAFAHLAQIAAPQAGLLFSCFRGPAENEIFSGVASLLPPPASPPDPHAPGPMAFADPERVQAILSKAGWAAVKFTPVDFAMVVGAGEDPVGDAIEYFSAIGPVALAAANMDTAEREAFHERLHSYVAGRNVDGIIAFAAAAWIVTATRG